MGADESTRFCCGACEHVARLPERTTSYAPSSAMFVDDAGPAPVLVAVYGGRCRIELTRGMRVTVGRAPTCDVAIADPFLSQRTCELSVTGDGAVYIADLDSACGTVVNDTKIAAPYRLHERDAIRIGNTVLVSAHLLPA
jgi:hypothetical protein